MKKKLPLNFIIIIIIIILLGLTPLLWFKNGFLIGGHDLNFPLNPINYFHSQLFSWSDSMGWDNSRNIPFLFPYSTLLALCQWIGLSLITTEKLVFIFYFILPGFSMYYLTSTLIKDEKQRIACLVSAIFYMFNLYVVARWHDGQPLLLVAYGLSPLVLGLFIRGLNKKEQSLNYAIFIAFISLIFAPVNSNPPMVIGAIIIPVIAYLIYYLSSNKEKITFLTAFRFTLSVALIYLLLNSWWLIPLSNGVFNIGIQANIPDYGLNWANLQGNKSSFLEYFRLLGQWLWYARWPWPGNPRFYSYASYYSSNFFLVLLTFLFPILAFSTLIFREKDKNILFFVLLSLFGLFLAKGIQEPFGFIYEFLYSHVPGFWIFRSPQIKFSPLIVIGYAFLIGVVSSEIYYRLLEMKYSPYNTFFSMAFNALIIGSILICSWPLFTGDAMMGKRIGDVPSYHVKVPDYYYDSSKWINDQHDDFRIFLLPWISYPVYVWGYEGSAIEPHLFHKPLLSKAEGTSSLVYTSNLTSFVNSSFQKNGTTNIERILRLLNVKYVLQRNDVAYRFHKGVDSPQHIKSFLSSQKGIYLEKSFGKLDFYKTSDEYFLPHIYTRPSEARLRDYKQKD